MILSTGELHPWIDKNNQLYMKKEYIIPKIATVNLVLEYLLAASVEKESIGVDNELGNDDDFNTNRRNGWENFWEDSSPFN